MGFETGVSLKACSQQMVQNLRLLDNTVGVEAVESTFSTIQDCFIVGKNPAFSGAGVELTSCLDVLVKNNQIMDADQGCSSTDTASTNGNSFVANYIANCTTGLELGSGDKYQGNVATGCATDFSRGIMVGLENG